MASDDALLIDSASTEQFAKRAFAELHRAIVAPEQKALIGDVEAIHDMRVAIRRLRVTLGNFAVCLAPEDRRRLRARLESLADALGGVRDLDIMIMALDQIKSTRQPEDHKAINSLIRRLKSRRRRHLRRLSSYLRSEEYTEFKLEFSSSEDESRTIKQKEHGQAA